MRFAKGNSGRKVGSKNKDTMSLKVLLENAFIRNQSAAIAKIDKMFQGDDMADFKFILSLKASVEPRTVAPTLVINNEGDQHTHITSVQLNQMSDNELIDFLTGRKNGITAKPA